VQSIRAEVQCVVNDLQFTVECKSRRRKRTWGAHAACGALHACGRSLGSPTPGGLTELFKVRDGVGRRHRAPDAMDVLRVAVCTPRQYGLRREERKKITQKLLSL